MFSDINLGCLARNNGHHDHERLVFQRVFRQFLTATGTAKRSIARARNDRLVRYHVVVSP